MRLLSSHLGRTLRAIRDDDVAARSLWHRARPLQEPGLRCRRLLGGRRRVQSWRTSYSYVNHETFNSQVSLLALTMVILGGLGNVAGAILGAVLLVSLPELFRAAAEYRMLIYGIALLLLIRFRPQGLLGTM